MCWKSLALATGVVGLGAVASEGNGNGGAPAWVDPNEEGLQVVAAYQPYGATSLDNSLLDLVGTRGLTKEDYGWSPQSGWLFLHDGQVYYTSAPVTSPPLTIVVKLRHNLEGVAVSLANFEGGSSNYIGVGGGNYIGVGTISDGRVCINMYDGGSTDVYSTATLEFGEVATVAAVFNSTTLRSLFVNGADKQSNTESNAPSAISRLAIGKVYRSGASVLPMKGGAVEAVAIYNRALSDTEVSQVTASAESLGSGWWTGGGSVAGCVAAYTAVGAASVTSAREDQVGSYDLTAADAQHSLTAPSWSQSGGWQFSLSHLLWGLPPVPNHPFSAVALYRAQTGGHIFEIQTHGGGSGAEHHWMRPYNYLMACSNTSLSSSCAVIWTAIDPDTDYVGTGVWSASNSRAVFLDGASKATNSGNENTGPVTHLSVGGTLMEGQTGGANLLAGNIYAMAFYKEALSDASVLAIANAVKALLS